MYIVRLLIVVVYDVSSPWDTGWYNVFNALFEVWPAHHMTWWHYQGNWNTQVNIERLHEICVVSKIQTRELTSSTLATIYKQQQEMWVRTSSNNCSPLPLFSVIGVVVAVLVIVVITVTVLLTSDSSPQPGILLFILFIVTVSQTARTYVTLLGSNLWLLT